MSTGRRGASLDLLRSAAAAARGKKRCWLRNRRR
jgi:hypothetical protein